MWDELSGMAGLWLSHALWYASAPTRAASLGLPVWRWTRWSGLACSISLASALAGLALMIEAHGGGVGTCCALLAWTAAAAVNTLLAPLRPRALHGIAFACACILVWSLLEALRGA